MIVEGKLPWTPGLPGLISDPGRGTAHCPVTPQDLNPVLPGHVVTSNSLILLDQQQVLFWLQTQGRAQCGLGTAILLTLLYLSPPGGPTAAKLFKYLLF